MTDLKFKVGQKVKKVGGEYELEGIVVAAFNKLNGTDRYVVEAFVPTGLLHIYGPNNLQLIED